MKDSDFVETFAVDRKDVPESLSLPTSQAYKFSTIEADLSIFY